MRQTRRLATPKAPGASSGILACGLGWRGFLLVGLLACGCATSRPPAPEGSLINFAHLEHLCEWAVMGGDSVVILHIYAEAPHYRWVAAPGEGIACVDDAARAAVTIMRHATLAADTSRLRLVRGLLRFVLKLQCEDGEFYNFVDQGLIINTEAPSSRKGFGFTAARAYWALASGYRFFHRRDVAFAAELRQAFLRCRLPLARLLRAYQRYELIEGRRYPRWLLQRYAADASSELLLGLVEFLRVENDSTLAAMARQLGEGLVAMQLEDSMPYPGAFLSWVGVWHAWGNAQSQALSALATLLGDRRLGQAAEREARQFLAHLVAEGLGHEFVLDRQTRLAVFPQIAYDVRCVALGLLGVAEATGDSNFAVAAGLAAGWLLGNNAAAQAMYDPATGRCYDALDGPGTINRNSGAESTIEALFTLVEVANHPVARRYLTCLPATAPACPCPAGRTCRSFTNGTSAMLSVCFDHQALDFAVFRCTQTEAAATEAEGHP